MVIKMSSWVKRKRKWTRRILIAESIETMMMTRVSEEDEELWVSAQDICDFLKQHKSPRKGGLTHNETTNRILHLKQQPFVEEALFSTKTALGNRTATSFIRIKDFDALKEYISECKEALSKIN